MFISTFFLPGALIGLKQQMADMIVNFQKLQNPPKCFHCGTEMLQSPTFILALDTDGTFSGKTLLWPVLVCPKDGAIQCVQNI